MGDPPTRQFMDDPNIKWAHGKPDFSRVDMKYLKEKSRNHKAESLEKLVENLVKTWEMESSHKIDENDWKCVDKDAFTISINSLYKTGLKGNIDMGNYNIFLQNCVLYDADAESNQTSHSLFRDAMPGGFAWELLDLFSGPPSVTFTWRHWGTYEGAFKGHGPTGEKLELYGMCIAKVTKDMKLQALEIYYDPNPMMARLLHMDKNTCPVTGKKLG